MGGACLHHCLHLQMESHRHNYHNPLPHRRRTFDTRLSQKHTIAKVFDTNSHFYSLRIAPLQKDCVTLPINYRKPWTSPKSNVCFV